MRIGIKYCGGCNPRYDRVAYVRTLAGRYPDAVFSPAEPEQDYDVVLVVCGCSAQCADVTGFPRDRLRYVCRDEPELRLAQQAVAGTQQPVAQGDPAAGR